MSISPARTYSVGTQPVPILEFPLQEAFMLRNLSTTVTVYIDIHRGVTAGIGFPLAPQSTKVLEPGDTCFAVCTTGQTAQLVLSAHSGIYFDPQAIASQIFISGVPAIDTFTLIISSTTVADGTLHDLAIGDISRYQSLRIQVRGEDTATGATPPGVGVCEVRQWSAGFSDLIMVDRCSFLGTNNRGTYFNQYLQVPCKGAALSLNLQYVTGKTITYQVYGSYRSYIDRLCGLMTNGYWGQSGFGTYQGGNGEDGYQEWLIGAGGIAAGASRIDYPNFHPGPNQLSLDASGNGASIDVFIEDVISGHGYYGFRGLEAAVGGLVVQQIILPARAVQLRLRNNAAGANAANVRATLLSLLQ